MSAANDAKDLVNNFAARTGTGVWLHIDRADLAQGLRARIDNPDLINQEQASLCGPADFFHDQASDDPVTYARAAIELYETGATNVGTQKIRPSHDLGLKLTRPLKLASRFIPGEKGIGRYLSLAHSQSSIFCGTISDM